MIKVHPFTYVYIFFSLVYHVWVYDLFLVFAFIHEMGHYVIAKYYEFDIRCIKVLPFGVFMSVEGLGKYQTRQELLMNIMGPMLNGVLVLVFYVLKMKTCMMLNMYIGLFNLLPIYPLDGSKIFLLTISYMIDYIYCYQIQIKLSLFLISIGCIRIKELGPRLVIIYLLYENMIYLKRYRKEVIETIIADSGTGKKRKINMSLKYFRPYDNNYIFKGRLYSMEEMKIYLIKSLNSR